MISRVIAVAAVAVALSGCATIVQGSKQSVSVSTVPVDGAKCELKNAEGTWYLTSPGSVEVHKTKTDLEIACSKDGVGSGKATAKAKFGGTTLGNVLAGGVIGIAVDAASGANFYYESPVTVTLAADGAVSTDAKPADGKPADAKDTKPADTKSAVPSADSNAAAPKSGDVKPVDAKPVAKPAEDKPATTTPTAPAGK